jgi:uncharacterized protein (TIGR03089 family)
VSTPWDRLSDELTRDAGRPFVTFYDDATGERVELSVATTANWVAKTAGYLIDEYDVQPGDVVCVRLPPHWQATVVVLATWAVGAIVSFEPGGVVTFTAAEESRDPADTGGAGGDQVVLTLAPMGADFSRLVAAYPDRFAPSEPSGADLIEAAPTDVPFGARILTVLPYGDPLAVSHGLIAPLATGGSIVTVRNPDAATLADRAAAERVSHTLGVDVPGIPRLDG